MRGFRMPSTGRIVMGLLVVIVSGLALSAAPTVVKATAADPYCYVSGYLGVDGWVDQGQDFAYVTGEVQVGTSVPGGYDMTWYHASCNLEAARIQVWLPDSYMDCLIGRQSGNGCENDSPSVPNAYTMADGEAYNQGGFYGLYTAYGQTYYWTNNLQALNYSLSLQKNFDFGYPEEEENPPDGCTPFPEYCTPILIPTTNSQRYALTDAASGVRFDLNGDGVKEQIAWTAAGEPLAFLALDRNGNGVIDDGSELFGGVTVPGNTNGFAALRVLNNQLRAEAGLSSEEDGAVDGNDPLYPRLLLWTDANHDGESQPSELRPFRDLFSEISLGYTGHKRRDGHGNLFRYRGRVTLHGGRVTRGKPDPTLEERQARTIWIYDVIFVRQ
jgi:hypothetical protein